MTRGAIDFNRPGIPMVASLPVGARRRDSTARRTAAGRAPSRRSPHGPTEHDVPLVDLKAAVAEEILAGRGNPDGIHWNFEAHKAVAELMLKALAEAGVTPEAGTQRESYERMAVVVVTDSSSRLPAADRENVADRAGAAAHSGRRRGSARRCRRDPQSRHPRPRTPPPRAQPRPNLREAYRQALDDSGGDGVVAVHISAALSGTFGAAEQAARQFGRRRARGGFEVGGDGYRLRRAGRGAACSGWRRPGCRCRRRPFAPPARGHGFIVVHRLDNLRRSGRIGGARVLAGHRAVD